MMYNKIVQDYFFSPQHVGSIDNNDPFAAVFKSKQKDQGDIEVYLQSNLDRAIVRACFKTNGNPYLIAGLEWLCRQLEGQLIDTIPKINYQELIKILEIPVAQYPLALRVVHVGQEVLLLMKNKVLLKR